MTAGILFCFTCRNSWPATKGQINIQEEATEKRSGGCIFFYFWFPQHVNAKEENPAARSQRCWALLWLLLRAGVINRRRQEEPSGAQTQPQDMLSGEERQEELSEPKSFQTRWTRSLKVKSYWNYVCFSWSQENMSWRKTDIFSSVYRPAMGNQPRWKELEFLNLRGSPPL